MQWLDDFCGKLAGIMVMDQVMELGLIYLCMNIRHQLPQQIHHRVWLKICLRQMVGHLSYFRNASTLVKFFFFFSEPGYYEDGQFGVRIEDVMQVVDANPSQGDFNGKGALKFIDITMAPIQTKMIKVELLTQNEVN